MKIHLDCHHAHRLAVKSMDMPLVWHERVRLRMHLFVCDMCRSFVQEMNTLRGAMRSWGRDEE